MALIITKKVRTILLIVLSVLVVGGGGFLIWRVTQEDSVAPEDSEAACPDGCQVGGLDCSDGGCCLDGDWFYGTLPDCVKPCPCLNGKGWCTCSDTPAPINCGDRVASDVGKAVGFRCKDKGSYNYECGNWCYTQVNGPSCCVPPVTKYTVIYKGNGGTCSPSSRSVEKGKTSAAPSCTRSGYTLSKFTKTSGSCGTLNTSSGAVTNVTCNLQITANWTKNKADTYTVTYKGNGGTCTPSSRSVEKGKTSAAPSCTRSGYTLSKFTKTSGSCGTLNTSSGAVNNVTCNLQITANWTEIKEVLDPACSARAKGYPYDTTGWGSENIGFCKVGSSATPSYTELNESFPEPGETVTWVCANSEGSVDCEASRADVDDPSCGTLANNYSSDAITWPSGTFCTVGEAIPSNPTFPTSGGSTEWDCGIGLVPLKQVGCTATRESDGGGDGDVYVPQTGIFDSVLGRVSVGVSFIFLGGLVSQYSKINYFFNSISQRNEFRREVKQQRRKEKRTSQRRDKLEKRFK